MLDQDEWGRWWSDIWIRGPTVLDCNQKLIEGSFEKSGCSWGTGVGRYCYLIRERLTFFGETKWEGRRDTVGFVLSPRGNRWMWRRLITVGWGESCGKQEIVRNSFGINDWEHAVGKILRRCYHDKFKRGGWTTTEWETRALNFWIIPQSIETMPLPRKQFLCECDVSFPSLMTWHSWH